MPTRPGAESRPSSEVAAAEEEEEEAVEIVDVLVLARLVVAVEAIVVEEPHPGTRPVLSVHALVVAAVLVRHLVNET